MTTMRCFKSGMGRVFRSPSLILWLYFTSLVLAVPLSMAMSDLLRQSIGGSMIHENLRQGFDLDWYSRFRFDNSGLADTFGPGVVGILPVLGNIDTLLTGAAFEGSSTVALAAIAFLLAWAFFGGGIIARYSRSDEPFTRSNLFTNCGEFFFRFVRLLVISILAYLALFRWVIGPLFRWISRSTRDVTTEGTVIVYTVLVYALAAAVLMILSLASDYAKISMVADHRRSAALAFLSGLRFVGRNAGRTIGLYLLLALSGLALIAVFAIVAPGPGQSSTLPLIAAFLVSQAFIVARIVMRLWFLASETALYRSVVEEQKPAEAVAPSAPAAAPVNP